MLNKIKNIFIEKKKEVPTRLWEGRLSRIRFAWEQTGAVVRTYIYDDFKTMMREFPTKAGKNEIHVAVLPWNEEADVVKVTKHNVCLEYPLPTKFENFTEEDMDRYGFLPKHTHCSKCEDFSTYIQHNGCCLDCEEKGLLTL